MVMAPGPTGEGRERTMCSDSWSTAAAAGWAVPAATTSAEVTASSAPWRVMLVISAWAVASIRTSPLKVAASRSGANRRV